MKSYNKKLWQQIIDIGRKQEPESKGIANKLERVDVETIVATAEYFGATDIWLQQIQYDLLVPKYRIFDWLAMCVMSRNDDNREINNTALQVLVNSYLKSNGNIKDFIADLRESDYDVDHSWEKIEIDVEE